MPQAAFRSPKFGPWTAADAEANKIRYHKRLLLARTSLNNWYGFGLISHLRENPPKPTINFVKIGMVPFTRGFSPSQFAFTERRVGINYGVGFPPAALVDLEMEVRTNSVAFGLVVEGDEVRECFSRLMELGAFSHVFPFQLDYSSEKAEKALAAMRRLARSDLRLLVTQV